MRYCLGVSEGLSCQRKMADLEEGEIQQSCLEQMEACCEESPTGPNLPNVEEKKQIAMRAQAAFDNEDDDCFQEEDCFDDDQGCMQWLCEEETEPVTPDKTVVVESPNPGQSQASTDGCEEPAATPVSLAASDNTPSVATVETPTQPSPSSSPETILPVRCEIHGRSLGATAEPKFMDVPLEPPSKKIRVRGKTSTNVAYARELDVIEDETFANITHAEFSKWVHSKKDAKNETQMKRLYKLGYNMVRLEYIKEKNKAMDPKERRSKGHYQIRSGQGLHENVLQ